MFLYWLELKKLLSSAAVWGFIAACLLFNVYLVISNSGDKYADFIGTASNDTGYILGQSFIKSSRNSWQATNRRSIWSSLNLKLTI